ncbi:MAG: sodium-dependent transporter [Clostridiales bacterium]|nr:sodium-dependent transporter [Clostridiales bacterium]
MKQFPQLPERAIFATKFAAIAATVGSAVGLGNIWRFPYEAGSNGGGAFMICYLAFVIIIGLPLLCAEFCMGRGTRSGIIGAYSKLKGGLIGRTAGYMSIMSSLMILSFYSVVAGWTMEYCFSSALGHLDFSDRLSGHDQFNQLTTGLRPLFWTILFLACNMLILFKGITKGIERASNIMTPLLFLLLIIFCIYSFTLPAFSEGVTFLFKPDFGHITPSVLLNAMGQAFFSLSLGVGCMMTYASYFNKRNNLVKTAVSTVMLDSTVAILAGIIIFPAIFSFGMTPEAGPTLVFEVLPSIFAQLPGGQLLSTMFFLLLLVASLTSTISMSEISITALCDEKKISRRKATIISSSISLTGGILCSLSFGPLNQFKIAGLTLFNLFDYATSNILMPLGGLILAIFMGWMVDQRFITDNLATKPIVSNTLIFLLRWICPVAIVLIFMNSIGIL